MPRECWRWMCARVEAGLLLIEVDYTSQQESPDCRRRNIHPMNLASARWCISTKKISSARRALAQRAKNGVARQLVGLEVDWVEVEERYEKFGLTPPRRARRRACQCRFMSGDEQVGRRQRQHGRRY